MPNLVKSIFIFVFIILLNLVIYEFFLKPSITAWGSSAAEVSMSMAGDNKALTVTSTRAISINAPQSDVWKWLIQLGADRGGFYSYEFIEKAMGYKARHQDSITPEFNSIKVGDLIRGSIDEKSSIIPYNFSVLYVKPEETFVLEKWGTFLLKKINNQQTRLIIRTQEAKSSSPGLQAANYIELPLHYIMERRTLIGIKQRAEAGENVQLAETGDILWFSAIVLSAVIIFFFIFLGRRGIVQRLIMPTILSSLWLFVLLLFPPMPLYSVGLLLIAIICFLYIILARFKS